MKTKEKSLEKFIKGCKFDWVNSEIKDGLFPTESVRGKVRILQFNQPVESEEVIEKGAGEGLVPANIYELLEYAKDGWDEKGWVVALGSVGRVYGDRLVPCLGRDGSLRNLYLGRFDDRWYDYYRFAFVRKESSPSEPQNLELRNLELPEILTINNITYKQSK